MVAISLYRGNLHRVPDVPRQWPMPAPKISLKDFKLLLRRRSRALSRLRPAADTVATTSKNPNPNPEEEGPAHDSPLLGPPKAEKIQEQVGKEGCLEEEAKPELKRSDGGDCLVKPVGGSGTFAEENDVVPGSPSNQVEPRGTLESEKPEATENPNLEECGGNVLFCSFSSVLVNGMPKDVFASFGVCEWDTLMIEALSKVVEQSLVSLCRAEVEQIQTSNTSNKEDALTDKDNRKREVEEKLQVLNARKHNLVQLLKQILNAEEELKRRSSMQGAAVRPTVTLQVDVTNDSGSMTRHATPRMGSEGNVGGDMEGGDADDVSNHNMQSRHLLRMSSTSPSSASPNRRPAINAVPLASRATLGTTVSPSRFGPTSQHGQPANLPTVSVSGTNYVASSPSPAASGGTSVFRDSRLPSPWN
ncbi:hypothetical protein RJ639_015760 [Escallonia herrerae]|uniref:Uncharacterized protein n=1 Tax=Escallonia herrerae TaxID=1293975 RepID=A0AA88VEM9_9ASTE|nr:hypothetical protein RJ639_015760 [Escallonia herrerae]